MRVFRFAGSGRLQRSFVLWMGACVSLAATAGEPDASTQSRSATRVASGAAYGDLIPTAQSIALFRQRIESDKDYQNRTVLGRLLLRQAREEDNLSAYAQAEQVLREAYRINPDHFATKFYLADALAARHRFDEAMQLLEPLHSQSPTDTAVLAALGDVYLNVGKMDQADELYAQLAQRVSGPVVLVRLAHSEQLHGQTQAAIDHLQEAVAAAEQSDLSPQRRGWYVWRLGDLQWSQGQFAAARDSFQTALQLSPDDTNAEMGLAKSLAALGDVDGAIERLQRTIARDPAPPALALLADLFFVNDQPEQAGQWLDKADLAMAEEAKIAAAAHHREYANLLADHALRPAQAVEMARADLERRPDVYSYDSMAWALYRNQDYVQAQQMIEHALQLGTRDAAIYYHAGMIKQANGDAVAAESLLNTSREINPAVMHWASSRPAAD
ncbi:tetratricopeptide repeat protein [Stieleria sp. TO1_6]|uniref:tetratricopeptide repeat protein n=1 Tax=Stieleria tagensis TaxID=2956795 RepID=UPI00209A8524|nr:tetratricopeptide repeat protein [Stieleria tagensis]MCO8125256.1 tetratricopeptide repeat protein [Stieleria tagensis]